MKLTNNLITEDTWFYKGIKCEYCGKECPIIGVDFIKQKVRIRIKGILDSSYIKWVKFTSVTLINPL